MFEFQWDGTPYEHRWQKSGWSIEVVRTPSRQIMVDLGHIDELSAHAPDSWTNWDDTWEVDLFLDCARRDVNVRTQIPIQADDCDYALWRFYYDTIIKYADEHLVQMGGSRPKNAREKNITKVSIFFSERTWPSASTSY